ncbi:hypothetical protein KC320_g22 [Hortaea werneckii]|nr:hypothetical protein KC320_g22 [Hortaea werneckii]
MHLTLYFPSHAGGERARAALAGGIDVVGRQSSSPLIWQTRGVTRLDAGVSAIRSSKLVPLSSRLYHGCVGRHGKGHKPRWTISAREPLTVAHGLQPRDHRSWRMVVGFGSGLVGWAVSSVVCRSHTDSMVVSQWRTQVYSACIIQTRRKHLGPLIWIRANHQLLPYPPGHMELLQPVLGTWSLHT